MAFRREALSRIGGFDVAMGAGTPARASEDTLAFTLVLLAGYRIAYEPAALVRHHHYAEPEGLRRQLCGYGIGLAAYYTALLRHRPGVLPELLRLLPAAAGYLRGANAAGTAAAPGLPAEFTRGQRRAMLRGPAAYIKSARRQARLAMAAEAGPPAARRGGTTVSARAQARPPDRLADEVPVLMYHSIATGATRKFRRFAVDPAEFAAQMEYLAAAGYRTVTAAELAGRGPGGPVPARLVVLTFDDAYTDFYSAALPVLREHGFRATLYVPTAYVGATTRFNVSVGEENRAVLSWQALADVAAEGIEVAAHSHSHPQLDRVPAGIVSDEVRRCRSLLEDKLGIAVDGFAYPFGFWNGAARRAVAAAGVPVRLRGRRADDGSRRRRAHAAPADRQRRHRRRRTHPAARRPPDPGAAARGGG